MPRDDLDPRALDAIPDPLATRGERPVPPPPVLPPSPARGEVRARRAIALGLAAAWIGGMLSVIELRSEVRAGAPRVVAPAIVWTVLAIVALVTALRRGRRGLGARAGVVTLLAVGVPAAFALAALLLGEPERGSAWGVRGCLGTTLALAAGPLVLAAAALRHAFAAAGAWRGALVGAAAGLLGALLVGLHCPVETRMHLVVAHGLPIALAALAGALAGRTIDRA